MQGVKLFFLGMIALSLTGMASVELGLITPAHALSLNAVMRELKETILGTEDRILKAVENQCGPAVPLGEGDADP